MFNRDTPRILGLGDILFAFTVMPSLPNANIARLTTLQGLTFLTLPFKLSSKGRWGPAPKQETFYETVAVTFCCMMCYCGWGPSYILMIRWFCPFKMLIIKESQIKNQFNCLVLFTNFYKVDQLVKRISKTFMNVYFFLLKSLHKCTHCQRNFVRWCDTREAS